MTLEDFPGIRSLLQAEGWGARADDSERLRRIVEASTRAVVAESNGVIVGFGRCVADDVSNGYLSMLVVDPRHRRRGIGRAIVAALIGDDPGVTWVLRAGHPESDRFWEGVGFRRSEIAYEKVRRR